MRAGVAEVPTIRRCIGASDEVISTVGSGVDFERCIAELYQNCRQPEEVKTSFEQLQLDLSSEINDTMVKTRHLPLVG